MYVLENIKKVIPAFQDGINFRSIIFIYNTIYLKARHSHRTLYVVALVNRMLCKWILRP